MTVKEKIEDLRQRMLNHKVVNDVAIVELSPKELKWLINWAEDGADHYGRLNDDW